MNDIPVLILAGGLGTRISKYYKDKQKCMIKFKGKPFLYYVIKNFIKNDFKNIIILTGYNSHQIYNYFYDGKKINSKIIYSTDGKRLLGTGGAVKKALKFVKSDFIIAYADAFLNYNYQKIYNHYKSNKQSSLLTVDKNKSLIDKNNVFVKKNKITYYKKQNTGFSAKLWNYHDWGISIFNKKVFKNIKKKIFDLEYVYQQQIKKKTLHSYEVNKKYYEIGSMQGIKKFKLFLNGKKNK